jgi:hypothetical protein
MAKSRREFLTQSLVRLLGVTVAVRPNDECIRYGSTTKIGTMRPGVGPSARTATTSHRDSAEKVTSRPQLQCSQCVFETESPEHLAVHLVRAHGRTIAQAWFEAGVENQRLYPKFAAPAGMFSVAGVNKARSTGSIISNCSSLEDAISTAGRQAESFPEIFVSDDSGRELYRIASTNLL